MKPTIFIVLLGLALPGTGWAQGSIFPPAPDLSFNADFSAASNSSQCVYAAGAGIFPRDAVDFLVVVGSVPAAHIWILQEGTDGSLAQELEITNRTCLSEPPGVVVITFPGMPDAAPPVPYYVYAQHLQAAADQMLKLLTGKWYVEVDFENTNYLSPLSLVWGEVRAPTAAIAVSPAANAFDEAGEVTLIAADSQNAVAVLDGSESTDPYLISLECTWSDGSVSVNGTTITNVFAIGTHWISLTVNDGISSDTTTATVQVVTPTDAVSRIISMVEQSDLQSEQELRLTRPLLQAMDLFRRGNNRLGAHRLQSFQKIIRPRGVPLDGATKAALNDAAQEIIDAVGVFLPGPHPRW